MIQPICRDVFFLSRPSRLAQIQDSAIGADLLDTLKANQKRCVGMAANMIGQAVRIIAVDNGGEYLLMYDPEILKREGAYEAEEGCLSLEGTRKVTRYKKIKVHYRNEAFQTRIKTFQEFTAQIIQHECDHLEGKIIREQAQQTSCACFLRNAMIADILGIYNLRQQLPRSCNVLRF